MLTMSDVTPSRLEEFLPAILQDNARHARFLALLAHLEYVGARKIAKALPADHASAAHLEHLMEEARHAFLLRTQAENLAAQAGIDLDYPQVSQAEPYLQGVDHGIAARLKAAKNPGQFLAYLAVSLIIEERAMEFYPAYVKHLADGPVRGTVQGILRDEVGHLEDMRALCSQQVRDAQDVLGDCRQMERRLYDEKFLPVLQSLAR